MSEEEKKEPRHPEVTFLPPLNMVLSFFDKKARERAAKKQAEEKKATSDEKTVTRLIEKLSETDKENKD